MNSSPLTVRALAETEWDAYCVSTCLPDDSSVEDILVYAADTDHVVCTQDLDFSDLLAISGRDRSSLVALRLSDAAPAGITSRLLDVLPTGTKELEHGAVVTIHDEMVRVHASPIQE